MMREFASVEDLEAGWRTLSPSESKRAQVLLSRASLFLENIIEKYNVDEDKYEDGLCAVCCDLVQRKLERDMATGINSITQTAGPFSESIAYASPRKSWELYPEDMELLGIKPKGAGMVKLAIHNGNEIIDW